MKLASFDSERIGVVRDDGIVDVTDLAGLEAGTWPPVGMVRLIADFERLRPQIERAAKERPAVPLAGVRLNAPVVWPNKVVAFPANYHDHIAEMNSPYRADTRGFFLKANSSISGPSDPIRIPVIPGRDIHHECELAIFIGKGGRDIPAERALEHVFGYACLIDVVIRGKEERVMRKSYDSFCPTGPWIVTGDEIADPANIALELRVNGEIRQSANTRDLILDIPGMIAQASSVMTLYPGDIFATGTPAGVGPVQPGDRVDISIEGVGAMSLDAIGIATARNLFF